VAQKIARATLSTGKIVLLKELKISHTETAAQEVAPRANGDANLLQLLMQKAMLKNLLISVDGKELSAVEREDMDTLFSVLEYAELLHVVAEMSGGSALGKKPTIDLVNYGDKSPGSVATPA
jgi:hypothetical protein